jgi:hypothetical protein
MIRVKGIWKLADEDTPGIKDGGNTTAAFFRRFAEEAGEMAKEISAGKYQTFNDAARALTKRIQSGPRPPQGGNVLSGPPPAAM